MGKRTAQKDSIIDITSDSLVNSNFPYRWSPASLTFNNYFYLFLCLYITRITINNNAPHLKLPKNQNRRAALGWPAMKLLRGGGGELHLVRAQQQHGVGISEIKLMGGEGSLHWLCMCPKGSLKEVKRTSRNDSQL